LGHETRAYETTSISDADGLAVRFLYKTIPGRMLLSLLIRRPISRLAGALMDSRISRLMIRRFIKNNNIKMEDFLDVKYRSFNDFFVREVKAGLRSFPDQESHVAAPCDGKLTAYKINADSVFYIKKSMYSVSELLKDSELAAKFIDGICLIFRLSPDDYHRYSFIDDGEILHQKEIKGKLHTVRPISQERDNVYAQNARDYTLIRTSNFGDVVQMEIGALFVGRIVNHDNGKIVKRGEEKGMFQFGGSSVIMLFQKDTVIVDEVFFENTQKDEETIVHMGSRIGYRM